MQSPPADVFEKKILDPLKHARLLKNIEHYAGLAGVAPSYIWTSVVGHLDENEVDYLRYCGRIAKEGKSAGLLYVTKDDLTEKFSLMTGALVRAFVDARMQTSAQIVEQMKAGEESEATVLFIPNFFSEAEFGKYDSYKCAALGELLSRRIARGLQTVIRVESLEKAKSHLSTSVIDLLSNKFVNTEEFKQGKLDV